MSTAASCIGQPARTKQYGPIRSAVLAGFLSEARRTIAAPPLLPGAGAHLSSLPSSRARAAALHSCHDPLLRGIASLTGVHHNAALLSGQAKLLDFPQREGVVDVNRPRFVITAKAEELVPTQCTVVSNDWRSSPDLLFFQIEAQSGVRHQWAVGRIREVSARHFRISARDQIDSTVRGAVAHLEELVLIAWIAGAHGHSRTLTLGGLQTTRDTIAHLRCKNVTRSSSQWRGGGGDEVARGEGVARLFDLHSGEHGLGLSETPDGATSIDRVKDGAARSKACAARPRARECYGARFGHARPLLRAGNVQRLPPLSHLTCRRRDQTCERRGCGRAQEQAGNQWC